MSQREKRQLLYLLLAKQGDTLHSLVWTWHCLAGQSCLDTRAVTQNPCPCPGLQTTRQCHLWVASIQSPEEQPCPLIPVVPRAHQEQTAPDMSSAGQSLMGARGARSQTMLSQNHTAGSRAGGLAGSRRSRSAAAFLREKVTEGTQPCSAASARPPVVIQSHIFSCLIACLNWRQREKILMPKLH